MISFSVYMLADSYSPVYCSVDLGLLWLNAITRLIPDFWLSYFGIIFMKYSIVAFAVISAMLFPCLLRTSFEHDSIINLQAPHCLSYAMKSGSLPMYYSRCYNDSSFPQQPASHYAQLLWCSHLILLPTR